MVRRRRRRSGGTWFPTQYYAFNESQTSLAGFPVSAAVNGTGLGTVIYPLTFDVPAEGDDLVNGDRLVTIIGNEYTLKRIVGNIFCTRDGVPIPDGNALVDREPAILAAFGLFVARANDTSGNEDYPIGTSSALEVQDNYSPLEADTIREPWIFRRTWILGGQGRSFLDEGTTIGTQGTFSPYDKVSRFAQNFPCSNILYGNALNGSYIDSRVKRRVRQDERLWAAFSATTWPPEAVANDGYLGVYWHFDYRIFGALRKARNQGAF